MESDGAVGQKEPVLAKENTDLMLAPHACDAKYEAMHSAIAHEDCAATH